MSSSPPLFSVIVPARDAEDTLRRTVESVLAQTLGDFELIIVENGSVDGTPEVARELADRDPRVLATSSFPVGLAAARNHGATMARGRWLCFLDADDEWRPGYLEQIAELAQSHPSARLLATNGDVVGDRVRERTTPGLRYRISRKLSMRDGVSMRLYPSAASVHADVYREVGGFSDIRGEDYDLFLRLLSRWPGYFSAQRLLAYHFVEGSRSRMPGSQVAIGSSILIALERVDHLVPDASTRRAIERKRRKLRSFVVAMPLREDLQQRMRNRDYRGARRDYWRARHGFWVPWRFWAGLPLMLLSPERFARRIGLTSSAE